MKDKKTLSFQPDYAVAPGATLKEALEERGISQSEFSQRADMSEKTVSQIINGVAPITLETAEKLEMVLGIPASYWNRRELSYRESLSRLEWKARFETSLSWLKEIPLKTLIERHVISNTEDKIEQCREALMFFGVTSVQAWKSSWGDPIAQYRCQGENKKRPGHVAAWLRLGELQAAAVNTPPFSADLFRSALSKIRGLTCLRAEEWREKLEQTCAEAGVVTVFTKEIPGAAVSGATRWLTKDKALIQLSLKFKTNDQIWFSFFHEAGHILLHKKKDTFVEFGHQDDTEEEKEANAFARNVLIPDVHASRLPFLKTRAQIVDFAHSIGIDAGIVVGRMQFDGLIHPAKAQSLGLKRLIKWID